MKKYSCLRFLAYPIRESFVKLAILKVRTQDIVMRRLPSAKCLFTQKLGPSFGDGSQDICKYKESTLGPAAGFYGLNKLTH